MPRHFVAALAVLTSLLVSMSVTAADITYLVIEKQARPLQIEEYSHNHSGIVTDIVTEIFAGTEHRVVTQTSPFKTMQVELEAGRYTNWLTFGSPFWGGAQGKNLSDQPLMIVTHSLVTTNDSSIQFERIEDLYGKTAILLEGFDYPGLEEHIRPGGIRVVRVKNYPLAFKMLDRLGKRAFLVEMKLRVLYNLKQEKLDIEHYKLQDFSSVIPPYNVHLAMAPDMPEDVQELVNQRLKKMHEQGRVREIIRKYR